MGVFVYSRCHTHSWVDICVENALGAKHPLAELEFWGPPTFSPSRNKLNPDNPYPLHLRGWKFTPLIKQVELKKHCKTRGFGQFTPLIKGVNLHPLN